METIPAFVITALCAFLIGSFPTAYVLVRRHHRKDLREEGSGNIGTLNAYEVTRSRGIGIAVLLIDLLKGALPVALVLLLKPDDAMLGGAALLSVVAGHNYSPWIGWKGGRGLASAAGASLLFSPLFPALWMLFWAAAFWRVRDVHFGNIAATVLSPLVVLAAPDPFIATSLFHFPSPWTLTLVLLALGALIMLRHLEPLQALIASRRHQ